MKSLKKYVCLIIALTLILNVSFVLWPTDYKVVCAKETEKHNIYLNETFENFLKTPPAGWAIYGTAENATITGKETGVETLKSAKFYLNNMDKHNLTFSHTLSYPVSGKVILEAKVKADRNDFYSPLFQVKSSIGIKSALITLTTEGAIKTGSQTIQKYQANKWYHIVCAVDMFKGVMDIYINGEKKAENVVYGSAEKLTNIESFKFYSKGQADKVYNLYIDDVRVYEGISPLDKNVFEEQEGQELKQEKNINVNINVQKMKERMKNAIALYVESYYAYVNTNKEVINQQNHNITPIVREETIFIPLKWFTEKLNMKYVENQKVNCITIEQPNLSIKNSDRQKVIKIFLDNSHIYLNNKSIFLENSIIQEQGIIYISPSLVKKLFDKEVFEDDRGLIIISDQKNIFDSQSEQALIDEVIKVIIYEHPTPEKLIADLKAKNPNCQHPRIFATKETFDTLKERIKSDTYISKWYEDLRKEADKVLEKPVGKYELPDGRRMQSARDARPYIEQTALMYKLSGEEKYLKRAIAELEAVIAFPDWNHQNEFLNTAEMTAGVAIGYDWLYDELSKDLKERIRKAIIDKGLQKALDAYASKVWWSQPRELINNWNAVCNGGIAMGALAIGDEEAIAGEALAKAMRSLEDGIVMKFSPDGGWGEGPGYWRYTIEYIVSFMASMESALGTTYGFIDTPGLKETSYYPVYITGAQGSFNYADASSTKMKIPELFWLAKFLNDPDLAGLRLNLMKEAHQAGTVYDILWYEPNLYNLDPKLPLDKYFRGTEVVTCRSRWNNVNGQFIGFKAGKGYMSHGHMDVGNFVFHANGEQWAIDLGSDNYTNGYFDYHTKRFNFYRTKPEGHNTIVINPDAEYQQDHLAFNKIERFETKPKGSLAIADMTPAYAKNVNKAKRGIMLTDNRRIAIVQDEIEAKKNSEIWWFMHTRADIEISEDGKSAVLTQNGKKLWAEILTPDIYSQAKFIEMEAKPFDVSPNPSGQKDIIGIKKLAIKLENIQEMNIAVALIPLQYGEEKPSRIPDYVPLAKWKIPEGNIDIPMAQEITIDGDLISGFKPDIYHYDIKLPFGTRMVPQIHAVSNQNVEIIQSHDLLQPAQVIVTSNDNNIEKTKYLIRYSILPSVTKPANVSKLDIKAVIASEEQVDDRHNNPAVHSVDGNLKTRWSAQGEQWIQYDLGDFKNISCVGISFSKGNVRSSIFNIEVSKDGQNWTKVYIGASSGTTSNIEYYGFIEQSARYLRINGNGNSVNQWNSYNEVEIYGKN